MSMQRKSKGNSDGRPAKRQLLPAALYLFGMVAVSTVIWSCGNSDKTSGDTAKSSSSDSFQALYTNTFQTACANCHQAGGTANADGVAIDFSSETSAYNTLTTSTVVGSATPACAGIKLVDTSNWQNSYLLAEFSQANAGSGNFVNSGCTPYAGHYESSPLSADDLASLEAWLQAGAPNN